MMRLLAIVFGGIVFLLGLAAIFVGLAISVMAFPFGVVLGFPISIMGGVIGGFGLSIVRVAGDRETLSD